MWVGALLSLLIRARPVEMDDGALRRDQVRRLVRQGDGCEVSGRILCTFMSIALFEQG